MWYLIILFFNMYLIILFFVEIHEVLILLLLPIHTSRPYNMRFYYRRTILSNQNVVHSVCWLHENQCSLSIWFVNKDGRYVSIYSELLHDECTGERPLKSYGFLWIILLVFWIRFWSPNYPSFWNFQTLGLVCIRFSFSRFCIQIPRFLIHSRSWSTKSHKYKKWWVINNLNN